MTLRESIQLAHIGLGEKSTTGLKLVMYAGAYEQLGKSLYGRNWEAMSEKNLEWILNEVVRNNL